MISGVRQMLSPNSILTSFALGSALSAAAMSAATFTSAMQERSVYTGISFLGGCSFWGVSLFVSSFVVSGSLTSLGSGNVP